MKKRGKQKKVMKGKSHGRSHGRGASRKSKASKVRKMMRLASGGKSRKRKKR